MIKGIVHPIVVQKTPPINPKTHVISGNNIAKP